MSSEITKFEFLGYEVAHIEGNDFVITSTGKSYEERFFNALLPYLSGFLFALLPEGTRYQGLKISSLSYEISNLLPYVPELQGDKIKIGTNKIKQHLPLPQLSGEGVIRGTLVTTDITADEMDSKFFSLGGIQTKYTANLLRENEELILASAEDGYYPNLIVKNENTTDRMKYSGVNEFFCMRLAKDCGILVPETFLVKNDVGYDYAIERFDIQRLSDDKCSKRVVLDIAVFLGKVYMENKYHSSSPELFGTMLNLLDEQGFREFARAYLYGYMIGNADMHLRNFSVFADYDEENRNITFSLTPVYDMLCTKCYARYPNDLGLGLYATGVGGAVSEQEFFNFLIDYLPAEDISKLVIDIKNAYIEQKRKVLNIVGTQYEEFLSSICSVISGRIENMRLAIDNYRKHDNVREDDFEFGEEGGFEK